MSTHSPAPPVRPIIPSDFLTVVSFGDGVAVFDRGTLRTTVLGALAGWVVTASEPTTFADLLATVAAESGQSVEIIESDLASTVDALSELGLVNRTSIQVVPHPPVSGSSRSPGLPFQGRSHRMLDHTIVFRSNDSKLVTDIDAALDPGGKVVALDRSDDTGAEDDSERIAPIFIDAEAHENGEVGVDASSHWDFPSRAGLIDQLHLLTAEFPSDCATMAALHAGSVRTPAGEVILIPGESDAGKSTLVAALVKAGCDYLGEECTGVEPATLTAHGCPRRLRLDRNSLDLLDIDAGDSDFDAAIAVSQLRPDVTCLSGPVGRVDHVVIPNFVPDSAFEIERLEPVQALRVLSQLVFNLGTHPTPAMATLARLAETVPCERVTHPGFEHVVAHILGD